MLLSDGFWRRRFGAAPSVVGQKITLNDNPTPDVVLVSSFPESGDANRSLHAIEVVARLMPGVSFD